MTIPKDLLGLAGEYRVCSELNKRGVFATITYGNRKGVDIYAIDDRHSLALKIEVKTSQTKKFLTRITQKYAGSEERPPDFWVLVWIHCEQDGVFSERFFILSHQEISSVQRERNSRWAQEYRTRHGTEYDFAKGCDNVEIEHVAAFDGQWSKITDVFQGASAEASSVQP